MGNVAKIEEQNRAGQSWKSGINQFTDLTKEEFVSTYASGKIASRAPRQPVDYKNMEATVVAWDPLSLLPTLTLLSLELSRKTTILTQVEVEGTTMFASLTPRPRTLW